MCQCEQGAVVRVKKFFLAYQYLNGGSFEMIVLQNIRLRRQYDSPDMEKVVSEPTTVSRRHIVNASYLVYRTASLRIVREIKMACERH